MDQNDPKSLKEKIKWFGWDCLVFLLCFLPGPVVIIIAVALLKYTSVPAWLLSPVIIAGWCWFNCDCWRYEAWRASGPRGIFVNTCGSTSNVLYNLVWLFFGFFIMVVNILLRFQLLHLNAEGRITLKKQEE